jgi:repressor LexA
MRGLTTRQREVLAALAEAAGPGGELPTLRELGERLGGITPAAVHLHLAALARKGYVTWPRGRPRRARLAAPAQPAQGAPPAARAWRVPVLGTIAAGRPIEAHQVPEDYVLVDRARLSAQGGDPRALYALRVRGDSMVDACIQDGDLVIVRAQQTARDGDTVVALLDGDQVTLKRFYREAGQIKLVPANPYYPAIFAKEVKIQGKVVGVVRFC